MIPALKGLNKLYICLKVGEWPWNTPKYEGTVGQEDQGFWKFLRDCGMQQLLSANATCSEMNATQWRHEVWNNQFGILWNLKHFVFLLKSFVNYANIWWWILCIIAVAPLVGAWIEITYTRIETMPCKIVPLCAGWNSPKRIWANTIYRLSYSATGMTTLVLSDGKARAKVSWSLSSTSMPCANSVKWPNCGETKPQSNVLKN